MKLFIITRNIIMKIVGLIVIILILACNNHIVDTKYRDQFKGAWEMEFTETKLSSVPPISIDIISILTLSAISFNAQIIAPESYEYLNRERTGRYWVYADTMFLNTQQIIYCQQADTINFAPLENIHKLRYNFINFDSVTFSVVKPELPDGYVGLPIPSFLWNTNEFYLCLRTSGTFARIDTK